MLLQEQELQDVADITMTMASLQRLAVQMQGGGRRAEFPDHCMVAFHMILPYLRNASSFKTVMSNAFSALFHSTFADAPSGFAPSKSSLNRHRVVFDVAYMMLKRQLDGPPTLRWLWMDSSPQAGRDWLQIKELYIRQADALQVAQQVETLALATLEGQELCLEDVRGAVDILEQCVHFHMRIPVAKSSG